jgi:DNA repair exonuclease SbcCD ATPase subunit
MRESVVEDKNEEIDKLQTEVQEWKKKAERGEVEISRLGLGASEKDDEIERLGKELAALLQLSEVNKLNDANAQLQVANEEHVDAISKLKGSEAELKRSEAELEKLKKKTQEVDARDQKIATQESKLAEKIGANQDRLIDNKRWTCVKEKS